MTNELLTSFFVGLLATTSPCVFPLYPRIPGLSEWKPGSTQGEKRALCVRLFCAGRGSYDDVNSRCYYCAFIHFCWQSANLYYPQSPISSLFPWEFCSFSILISSKACLKSKFLSFPTLSPMPISTVCCMVPSRCLVRGRW